VSLAALLVSLFLFVYFKSLSCSRIFLQKIKLFIIVVTFWPGWRAFCVSGRPACLSVPVRLLQVPVLQKDPTSKKAFCQSCCFLGRLAGFLCPWPPCLSPSSSLSTSSLSPAVGSLQKKLFAKVVAFWSGWGLSVSLAALLVSLFLFIYFKSRSWAVGSSFRK
jgi:hypothetical protein